MRSVRSAEPRCTRVGRKRCLLLSCMAVLVASSVSACGAAIEHPTGAADLVLRIETGGGFVPVEYSLTQVPVVSLYGDGTVIVSGPMIEIYPQPALPNLQQTTITQGEIAEVLDSAKKAGLLANDVDYGTPSVADAATTTITINADGQTYVSTIYALGLSPEDIQESADMIGGLTAEQIEARAAVTDFYTKDLYELATLQSPDTVWQEYDFASLAVFSMPFDPSTAPTGDEVQPNHLDWPLDDLSTAGEPVQPQGYRELVVTGEDLDTLRPLLDQATKITLWNSGGREYYLYFRPLLPDESA